MKAEVGVILPQATTLFDDQHYKLKRGKESFSFIGFRGSMALPLP